MPNTYGFSNSNTITEASTAIYKSAKTEPTPPQDRTYQCSEKIQSAPTSRTVGEIKLRIAPREMPDQKIQRSTK